MIKRIAFVLAFATLLPVFQSCAPTGTKPPTHTADNGYVGLPLSKAENLAESRGLKHRVIKKDGRHLPATKDYRPDRINFEIKRSKVVAVSRG